MLIIRLQLAQSRERVRQDILNTFEDIPGIIAMACSKSRSFPEDFKLHDSIDDLKVTLFDAIPGLIEMYMPGNFSTRALPSGDRGIYIDVQLNDKSSSCNKQA